MSRERRIYLGVAFATAVGHLPLTSLPFEVGAIKDGLGLSESVTGLLATIELSTYALTNLVIAPFISKLSPRRLAVTGVSLAVIGTIVSAYCSQIVVFSLVRALVGLGFGLTFSCANAVGAMAKIPERAYSIGYGVLVVFGSMLPLALGHSTALTSTLRLPQLAHSSVFLAMAAFTALMAPSTLLLPRRLEVVEATNSTASSRAAHVLESIACIGVVLFFSMGVFGVYTFIERRGRLLGMDLAEIGNMVSFAIAVGLIGTFCSAFLGRRLGLAIPLVTGLLVQGASCAAIAWSPTAAGLAVATQIFMSSWGFVYPYMMGLGAAIDPSGRLPTGLGAAYLVGSSAATAISGIVMQAGGFGALGGVSCGLCVSASVMAFAVARRGTLAAERSGNVSRIQ